MWRAPLMTFPLMLLAGATIADHEEAIFGIGPLPSYVTAVGISTDGRGWIRRGGVAGVVGFWCGERKIHSTMYALGGRRPGRFRRVRPTLLARGQSARFSVACMQLLQVPSGRTEGERTTYADVIHGRNQLLRLRLQPKRSSKSMPARRGGGRVVWSPISAHFRLVGGRQHHGGAGPRFRHPRRHERLPDEPVRGGEGGRRGNRPAPRPSTTTSFPRRAPRRDAFGVLGIDKANLVEPHALGSGRGPDDGGDVANIPPYCRPEPREEVPHQIPWHLQGQRGGGHDSCTAAEPGKLPRPCTGAPARRRPPPGPAPCPLRPAISPPLPPLAPALAPPHVRSLPQRQVAAIAISHARAARASGRGTIPKTVKRGRPSRAQVGASRPAGGRAQL